MCFSKYRETVGQNYTNTILVYKSRYNKLVYVKLEIGKNYIRSTGKSQTKAPEAAHILLSSSKKQLVG
jgi:hypothetical protein